jgi:hypothetical protein
MDQVSKSVARCDHAANDAAGEVTGEIDAARRADEMTEY